MKKVFSLLAIVALSTSIGHANDSWRGTKGGSDKHQKLSYSGGWTASFGLSQGFAQYDLSAMRSTDEGGVPNPAKDPIGITSSKVEAYRVGMNTGFGYRNWFYLQIRSAFSIGVASEMTSGLFVDPTELSSIHFLDDKSQYIADGDATLFVPFRLSKRHNVNIYPAIGFAAHSLNYKARINGSDSSNFYKLRFLAPFAGLYFSVDPAGPVGASWGFAFHLPRGKQAFFVDEATAPTGYEALKRKRHGLSSTLELHYRVKDSVKIAGSFDYYAYQVYGAHSGNESTFGGAASSARAYLKQLAATIGVEWQF